MSFSSMIKTIKSVINYNDDDTNKETKQEKIENQHKLLFDEIKIRKSSTNKPKEINKILSKNLKNSSYDCFREILYSIENYIENERVNDAIISINEISTIIKKAISEVLAINLQEKKESNGKFFSKEYILTNKEVKCFKSLLKINNFLDISDINNIINRLLDYENFEFLCEKDVVIDFINTIKQIIMLNNPSKIIFQVLSKKLKNFINYHLSFVLRNSDKKQLKDILDNLPNVHSETYDNFKDILTKKDIYFLLNQNFKIENYFEIINNFKESLELLSYYYEQFEIIGIYAKEIIPPMLNQPSLELVDLYKELGNFLMKILFLKNYIIDTSLFESGDCITGHNFIVINNDKNEYDIREMQFLDMKTYEISYQFDILQAYYNEIINLILEYYIKPLIYFDISFDIQMIIYKMLKKLYFIYPSHREKFINYIPDILNNISYFKELNEWNVSLECRHFCYYLILNNKEIGPKIKSLTAIPIRDIKTEILYFRDINLNLGYYNQLEIKPGSSKEIKFDLDIENCILYFAFNIENEYDINVKISKYIDKKYIVVSEIEKIKSISEDGTKKQDIKIIIFSKNAVPFTLEFDNSYSWFNSKIIHYSSTILRPIK